METRLPFPGFYDSLYSSELDNIEEQQVDWIDSSESYWDFPEEVTREHIRDEFWRYANYSAMYQEIASKYPDVFSDFLSDKTGMIIPLTFKTMLSPREYNFETDQIYADIELTDVLALYEWVGEEKLRKQAQQMFTSRSGYISFYDPDIDTWGPVSEWDHNQLYCLMLAVMGTDDDMDIYYRLVNDVFYTAFTNNVDWAQMEHDLKFFGKDEDMKFPPIATPDTEYIQKFNELNHLVE